METQRTEMQRSMVDVRTYFSLFFCSLIGHMDRILAKSESLKMTSLKVKFFAFDSLGRLGAKFLKA